MKYCLRLWVGYLYGTLFNLTIDVLQAAARGVQSASTLLAVPRLNLKKGSLKPLSKLVVLVIRFTLYISTILYVDRWNATILILSPRSNFTLFASVYRVFVFLFLMLVVVCTSAISFKLYRVA
ncbi:hypothetical protein FPOAC2_00775 [Fusarium poae]|jgi:hypothetical protein